MVKAQVALLARKSNIYEFIYMMSGQMNYRNDPFLHRFSDVAWRFGECGIKKDTVRQLISFSYEKYFDLELEDIGRRVTVEEDTSLAVEKLWLLIFFVSAFLPILALMYELATYKPI